MRDLGDFDRVVAHVDLDCFYCQVEHRRLQIPRDHPLAVQQWNGLIAVNYAARSFGVRRGHRVAQALEKCPQLRLVHVDTIENKFCGAVSHSGRAPASNQQTKISLERYRAASAETFAIITSIHDKVERASIDEAYIDLTEDVSRLVDSFIKKMGQSVENATGQDASCERSSILCTSTAASLVSSLPEAACEKTMDEVLKCVDGGAVSAEKTPEDALLVIGSVLVSRLRKLVVEKTAFTLSAGVAKNKVRRKRMLAKLASARCKPNNQVIVPDSAVDFLMAHLEIKDLRGLGGKFGDVVQTALPEVKNASELQTLDVQQLQKLFGMETATWLYKSCRGHCDRPVTPNIHPKSMLASKSFSPAARASAVKEWLRVLSSELNERMRNDFDRLSRRPKTLAIYAKAADQTKSQRSRCGQLPPGRLSGGLQSVEQICDLAEVLLARIPEGEAFPCSRIGLGVLDFESTTGCTNPSKSILSFVRERATATSTACEVGIEASGREDALQRHSQKTGGSTAPKRFVSLASSVSPDASDTVIFPATNPSGPRSEVSSKPSEDSKMRTRETPKSYELHEVDAAVSTKKRCTEFRVASPEGDEARSSANVEGREQAYCETRPDPIFSNPLLDQNSTSAKGTLLPGAASKSHLSAGKEQSHSQIVVGGSQKFSMSITDYITFPPTAMDIVREQRGQSDGKHNKEWRKLGCSHASQGQLLTAKVRHTAASCKSITDYISGSSSIEKSGGSPEKKGIISDSPLTAEVIPEQLTEINNKLETREIGESRSVRTELAPQQEEHIDTEGSRPPDEGVCNVGVGSFGIIEIDSDGEQSQAEERLGTDATLVTQCGSICRRDAGSSKERAWQDFENAEDSSKAGGIAKPRRHPRMAGKGSKNSESTGEGANGKPRFKEDGNRQLARGAASGDKSQTKLDFFLPTV